MSAVIYNYFESGLSVPVSSAAVERMFSIARHIFLVKRGRLGIEFFSRLIRQLLLLKIERNFYRSERIFFICKELFVENN